MRFVRYSLHGEIHHGVLEGETVAEIAGGLFDSHARTGRTAPLSDVKLLPPNIPPTFYASGLNYITHLREQAVRTGQPVHEPREPSIGLRTVNSLIGTGDTIVIPADSSGKVQFEGELVAVIGRAARHVPEADALSHVFGYSIGNDVSERVWQRADRTHWRAKNCDTFKPMGPWIETDVDLDALVTQVKLNGKIVSTFRTNDMLFGVATHISRLSRYVTLVPGDMIWMGTDEPTLDMVAGDHVEVSITGLGTLANPVAAEVWPPAQ